MEIAQSHDYLILDACCIINLYASRKMDDVLRVIHKPIAVASYVYEVESLRIYGGPENDIRQKYEKIDLQTYINDGLLVTVSPNSDTEENTFINLAAVLGDDGEAITGAIAYHRTWAIGTDDRKTRNLFAKEFPQLQLVSTPEMIKHWVETAQPQVEKVRTTLKNIELRANYIPGPKHELYEWWQSYRA